MDKPNNVGYYVCAVTLTLVLVYVIIMTRSCENIPVDTAVIKWGPTEYVQQFTAPEVPVKTRIDPEGDLMRSISDDVYHRSEFDNDAYAYSQSVKPSDEDAHAAYVRSSRPVSGYILAQNESIYEPPPQKYYSPYRHARIRTSNISDPLRVSGIDDDELYTSWSMENSA